MEPYSGKENVHPTNKLSSSGGINRRKANKQVMERNRRARINKSLDQLKDIVLTEMGKNPFDFEKIEKADILEMAVQYLQSTKPKPLTSMQQVPASCPVTVSTTHPEVEVKQLEACGQLPLPHCPIFQPCVLRPPGPSPLPLSSLTLRNSSVPTAQPISRGLVALPTSRSWSVDTGYESPDSATMASRKSAIWRPF